MELNQNTRYAIRQSSKGWSDIVCIAATHDVAEKLVARFYEDQDNDNKERERRGLSLHKSNFRIEEISYFTIFPFNE